MRDNAIIAEFDKFADERVGLHSAALANSYVSLDLDEWPDEGVIANGAPVDIGGLDDGDPFAEADILDSDRLEIRISHVVVQVCSALA